MSEAFWCWFDENSMFLTGDNCKRWRSWGGRDGSMQFFAFISTTARQVTVKPVQADRG